MNAWKERTLCFALWLLQELNLCLHCPITGKIVARDGSMLEPSYLHVHPRCPGLLRRVQTLVGIFPLERTWSAGTSAYDVKRADCISSWPITWQSYGCKCALYPYTARLFTAKFTGNRWEKVEHSKMDDGVARCPYLKRPWWRRRACLSLPHTG